MNPPDSRLLGLGLRTFYGLLSLFAATVFAHLWLGDLLSMVIAAACLFGMALSYLSVLMVGIAGSDGRGPGAILIASACALIVWLGAGPLRNGGEEVFLSLRQAELEILARDLVAGGRITEMCDGSSRHRRINGAAAVSASEVSELLRRTGIDESIYLDYQERLRSLGFRAVEVRRDHVAFLKDGLLGELHGFLLLRRGGTPPAPRDPVFDTPLLELEPMSDIWYRFHTT